MFYTKFISYPIYECIENSFVHGIDYLIEN